VSRPGLTGRETLLSVVLTALTGALFAAVTAAVLFRWEPAAWAIVAIITAEFAVYLVVAVIFYRRTMRREWPKVEPLTDDDDDWD
jgi:hypothetical protein